MITRFPGGNFGAGHDVCIVGSGPVGLALALGCAANGLRVLVLESGTTQPTDSQQALNAGEVTHLRHHARLEDAASRALGGTSHWWGGRCIPFDPVDFRARANAAGARWPIRHDDVAPWYPRAAAYFGCGPAEASRPSDFAALRGLRCDQVERWCPVPNMAARHEAALREAKNITVATGGTVVDLEFAEHAAAVTSVVVQGEFGRRRVPTPRVVLACGGIQTCRLLLAVQQRLPHRFGGRGGPLGRYYMGHLSGKVADITLFRPQDFGQLDFFIEDGAYARRRFTLPEEQLIEHDLPNISFLLGNARIADPGHGSGALSLLWMALASPLGGRLLPKALRDAYLGPSPYRYGTHLANIACHMPSAIAGGFKVFKEKHLSRPSKPAFVFASGKGVYSMFYHAEQSPSAANRIVLSTERDAMGVPKPLVQFQFGEDDATRVRRAHDVLASALAESGIGRLEYHDADATIPSRILDQATDGLHQVGGVRMSARPGDGVVNGDCRVHDVDNLYVAGSSVFPTSGNANPTFLAAALAFRLAEHLRHCAAATPCKAAA